MQIKALRSRLQSAEVFQASCSCVLGRLHLSLCLDGWWAITFCLHTSDAEAHSWFASAGLSPSFEWLRLVGTKIGPASWKCPNPAWQEWHVTINTFQGLLRPIFAEQVFLHIFVCSWATEFFANFATGFALIDNVCVLLGEVPRKSSRKCHKLPDIFLQTGQPKIVLQRCSNRRNLLDSRVFCKKVWDWLGLQDRGLTKMRFFLPPSPCPSGLSSLGNR